MDQEIMITCDGFFRILVNKSPNDNDNNKIFDRIIRYSEIKMTVINNFFFFKKLFDDVILK